MGRYTLKIVPDRSGGSAVSENEASPPSALECGEFP